MTKLKNIGLLPKVLIAIVLGILISLVSPIGLTRAVVTFSTFFNELLGMFIPILIIGLIAPSIGELGKNAGKLLLITVVIAYLSTLISGFFAYFSCREVYPFLIEGELKSLSDVSHSETIEPYFTIGLSPIMPVMTALAISFMIGIGVSMIQGQTLKGFMGDIREVVFLVIDKLIIPLLPVYVFCVFLQIGVEGKVAIVIGMFFKVILVIVGLHIILVLSKLCFAGIISKINPFKALVTMLPAYATALGTQSSAATIPVTSKQINKLGINSEVSDFVVPLCATIHLPGSMSKIVACCLALSFSMNMPIGLDLYCGFIFMLSVLTVAAPAVPGGAIMVALGLISSTLGFDSDLQGVMFAIYIALDGFGTAANVTSDCAIAQIIDKIRSRRLSLS